MEACRSESDDVGVGWGKDWGKGRSRIGGFHFPRTGVGTVPPGAIMATVRFERTQFLPGNLADTVGRVAMGKHPCLVGQQDAEAQLRSFYTQVVLYIQTLMTV